MLARDDYYKFVEAGMRGRTPTFVDESFFTPGQGQEDGARTK